ncbi:MAG: glycosyltransferase family 39 protein [Caldilineales bacterium]
MTTAVAQPVVIDVTPGREIPRRSPAPRLAMMVTLLIGFGLRVQRLGVPSLWLDEMGQATPALRGLGAVIDAARRHHGAAPLDYLLTWLALHVAQQEFVARLPAALLGTLTVALVYLLAREVFDELEGVLAALLLAVAPLHLRYSQEARFYALFACAAVASMGAFLIALRRNDRRSWVVYTLLLIAGLYSHYYMPLVVAAQGAGLLAARLLPRWFPLARGASPSRALRRFLASCAVAALAFLPWLLYAVVAEKRVPRGDIPQLTLATAQQTIYGLFLSGPPLEVGVERWLPWLYAALVVAGMIAGLARRRTRTATLPLTLLVFLGPPAILLALRWILYFFEVRQVLFLLPLALTLTAAGVAGAADLVARLGRSPRSQSRLFSGVTAFLALLLIGPLLPASQAALGTAREDWRGALGFVAASAAPDEVILVPGLGVERYLRYYTADWPQPPLIPTTPEEASSQAQSGRAAWIVTIPQTAGIATQLPATGGLRLDFAPKVTVAYLPGTDMTAAELSARAAAWAAPDNAAAAQDLADTLEAAGDPAAAKRVLTGTAAHATDPRTASLAEVLLGALLSRQGDALSALAAYRRAADLWPDNVEARVRLGEALLLSGDAGAASKELGAAVSLAPDHFWARRFLGQAYLQLGEPRQAALEFAAALAIDPTAVDTYVLLGDARAAYRDRRGASDAYSRFLELAPDSPLAEQVQRRLEQLKQN